MCIFSQACTHQNSTKIFPSFTTLLTYHSFSWHSACSDIRDRGDMTEWLKMQNRVDISPQYLTKYSASKNKMWEGKGMEPLVEKGPNQKKYESLVTSQGAAPMVDSQETLTQPQNDISPPRIVSTCTS